MLKTHRSTMLCACALGVLTSLHDARAGDLNPPAGPVAPTMKPLSDVEPRTPISAATTPGDANSTFRITQPGSYYLTGNVTGVAGRHGIEVASGNVTIDLMGFTLQGVPGSIDGITDDGVTQDNLRVINGVIHKWGADGIDFAVPGENHHISAVHASTNGGDGIRCGSSAVVESCTASLNASSGIVGLGSGFVVRGCTATDNSIDGITTASPSTVSDCSAYSNSGAGFAVGAHSTLTGCSARFNTQDGINAGTGSTIVACSSGNNGGNGIQGGVGALITNCAAISNAQNGIAITTDGAVLNNTCDNNVVAGIHASAVDNRIQGNNVTDNAIGINVLVTGNLIVSNSASGNTSNYVIVAGNSVGQIISVAGSTITSSNSWANLSF